MTATRRLLRIRDVAGLTGLGKTTIWRRTKEGKFPAPIKEGKMITAWVEDEVRAWIDAKIASRDQASAQP